MEYRLAINQPTELTTDQWIYTVEDEYVLNDDVYSIHSNFIVFDNYYNLSNEKAFELNSVEKKPRFSTANQNTFEKQSQIFGYPGRKAQYNFHKYNIGVTKYPRGREINLEPLVGFHPLTGVPHMAPYRETYPIHTHCTADFERLWQEPDIEGYRTSVLFVDIHSRYPFTVLLKSYSEFLDAFKKYQAFIWTNFQKKIVYFYADSDTTWQATEEIKQAKTKTYQYMQEEGILLFTSPPNTHQLNGLVETISGMCFHYMNRFLMIGRMSQKLRGRAWMCAVVIYSITPGPSSLPQFKD